jgi:hypothetical protein
MGSLLSKLAPGGETLAKLQKENSKFSIAKK